jgi:hypothetical protein
MHRSFSRRLVMLLATLLVATSLSTKAIGASACECCGPRMAAPAAPAPPCCVRTIDRRMAVSTSWHSMHSVPVVVKTLLPSASQAPLDPREPSHPPGWHRPIYLSISVLRI